MSGFEAQKGFSDVPSLLRNLDGRMRSAKDATERMWLQGLKGKLEGGASVAEIMRHMETRK